MCLGPIPQVSLRWPSYWDPGGFQHWRRKRCKDATPPFRPPCTEPFHPSSQTFLPTQTRFMGKRGFVSVHFCFAFLRNRKKENYYKIHDKCAIFHRSIGFHYRSCLLPARSPHSLFDWTDSSKQQRKKLNIEAIHTAGRTYTFMGDQHTGKTS